MPGPEPQVSPQNIEETRRQIQRLFEEVARLSELDLTPADYFGEFLKRVLTALAAPAGVVWMRTPQGNLQLQYQINLANLGLNRSEEAQQAHQELLRLAFQQPRPIHLPPQSFAGQAEQGRTPPGNPTDLMLLLIPIQVENQVDGLLEVWQDPNRNPAAVNGFLQFMTEMSQLASRYLRNRLMRQMAGQQALWTQLEAFARSVHGSLNPTEVSYVIANEGRRLIDCDRVSIGVRYARKIKVEAVSGADVVERRSNLVQLMRKLFDRVIAWGEKLVYTGTKDEGLPPDVMAALDAYLAESNSKVLVVLPLKDERDKDTKRLPRSAMMMECFEPQQTPEQLVARMDVVGKHAAPALYNAVEHRRIPMRLLWVPLAKIQEGLGGKARAIMFIIAVSLALVAAMLYFLPYELKMDATGNLLPEERAFIHPQGTGFVVDLRLQPNEKVRQDQKLVRVFNEDLREKLKKWSADKVSAEETRRLAGNILAEDQANHKLTPQARAEWQLKQLEANSTVSINNDLIDKTLQLYNAQGEEAGHFWLRSPHFREFRPEDERLWTVLTPDFRDTLRTKPIDPKEPVLRLGYVEGPWEVETKIPQKHIGQVLHAFDYLSERKGERVNELDVDLVVRSDPTRTYHGKLHRDKIANQADPHKDDNNETEPVVMAWVRIAGTDIDKPIPKDLLTAGTEVKVKILCGPHRMGYSLFYGVWEFFYEKVVFFF